jgi:hypothetical protein
VPKAIIRLSDRACRVEKLFEKLIERLRHCLELINEAYPIKPFSLKGLARKKLMRYLDQYQIFQTAVAKLAKDLTPSTHPAELKQHLTQLQATFSQTIARIDLTHIPSPANQRLQSLHVEIAKELRLLQVDLLFLQTAKQPHTVADRQQQIQNRLGTLLRYCTIVLAPPTPEALTP